MPTYSEISSAIAQQVQQREKALPLKNEACRSRFWFHPHPTAKVFLFFHGFTAGPYQFEPLGRALFAEGYNVLTPLQPGHGQAGDWGRDNPPPLPEEIAVYQQFAMDWLQQASQLGQTVVVGGLSSGANLATWLSLEQPQQIDRTLLFAPYLSGSNLIMDWLVQILPYYFEWFNKDLPGNYGYKGFHIPALRIFLDLAQEVIDRAKQNPAAPGFLLSSEADLSTSPHEHQELFEALRTYQPKSWYHRFDKSLDIPHTMMTRAEGNQYQDLLITLVKAYIHSDLTWDEVNAIASTILTGKTFEAAVAELNLEQRTAPEVSVFVTLMETEAMVETEG